MKHVPYVAGSVVHLLFLVGLYLRILPVLSFC
jgi:hypothetical protein